MYFFHEPLYALQNMYIFFFINTLFNFTAFIFPRDAYFSFCKIFLGAFKLFLPHFLCLFFSENFNPFSVGNRACTQGRKCRSHRQTFFLFHKVSYQGEILFEVSMISYLLFAIFVKKTSYIPFGPSMMLSNKHLKSARGRFPAKLVYFLNLGKST